MQIFWIFYFQVQKEHRKTAKVLAVLNVNRRQPQNDKATQKIGSVALDWFHRSHKMFLVVYLIYFL